MSRARVSSRSRSQETGSAMAGICVRHVAHVPRMNPSKQRLIGSAGPDDLFDGTLGDLSHREQEIQRALGRHGCLGRHLGQPVKQLERTLERVALHLGQWMPRAQDLALVLGGGFADLRGNLLVDAANLLGEDCRLVSGTRRRRLQVRASGRGPYERNHYPQLALHRHSCVMRHSFPLFTPSRRRRR
jgi:hypothetical protein